MKPLLVADFAGPTVDIPISPWANDGGRLAEAAGLNETEFLEQFDRVTLVPNVIKEHVLLDDALHNNYLARAADNLRPIMRGRRCVLIGSAVCRAFGIDDWTQYSGVWERWHECVAAVISTRALPRWDEGQWRANLESFMRRSLMPCVHVEGPDGCGKSTLIPDLKALLSGYHGEPMVVVPTEGPPKCFEECLTRIAARVEPGIVSDRSSGLISELVYGPVLRGGVCGGDEEPYWQIVRSFAQAVTFVYCRPPLEALRPNFRPEEPENFARDVLSNMAAIANRYDEVMQRVQAMGGRVIIYDRTSMTAEDVARCVV